VKTAIYITLWCLLVSNGIFAQNLIQNPSFEDIYGCPQNFAELDSCKYWYNVHGSPDLFHTCGGWGFRSDSVHFGGYQKPVEGFSYVGMMLRADLVSIYGDTNTNGHREYFGQKLSSSLQIGAKYSFAIAVSLGERSTRSFNKLGLLCSTVDFNHWLAGPIIYRGATLEFDEMIDDTANWVYLSDTFICDSAYQYIFIGGFSDSADMSYKPMNPSGSFYRKGCYIFIDDLSLIKIRDPLKITKDTALCASYTDSIQLKATAGFKNYAWYNVLYPGVALGTDSLLKVKPTQTTTYRVLAEGDTAYATVTINPLPTFTLGKDTLLCNYSSHTLQANLAPSLVKEYSWSTNSTSSIFTAAKNNSLVWHQITDTNGCIWRDTINLSWQTPPVLQLLADTLICQGGIAQLQAQVTDSVSGATIPASNYQLTWQTNTTLTTLTDSTAQAKPLADTRYFATVSDGKCTGNTDSVWVIVQANPITQLTPDTQRICLGQQAQVQASGGQTYVWSINGTLDAETNQSQLTQTPSNSLFVAVQAIQAPCVGQWDTAWIIVDTVTIIADFTVSPTEGFTTFEPLVTNTSKNALQYEWQWGNGQILQADEAEDLARGREYTPAYTLAGTYTIELKASRPFAANGTQGCFATASQQIQVNKKFILEIPNAFSPNQDGLNERFNIVTSDGVAIQGTIYNRWGEIIYQWDTTQEGQAWDGTYQGKPVPNGVYFYMLSLKELDKTAHYKQGTLNVVR
jgi:gliding motility-associated-like protein